MGSPSPIGMLADRWLSADAAYIGTVTNRIFTTKKIQKMRIQNLKRTFLRKESIELGVGSDFHEVATGMGSPPRASASRTSRRDSEYTNERMSFGY